MGLLFKTMEISEYSTYQGQNTLKKWLGLTNDFNISMVFKISVFKISESNCTVYAHTVIWVFTMFIVLLLPVSW